MPKRPAEIVYYHDSDEVARWRHIRKAKLYGVDPSHFKVPVFDPTYRPSPPRLPRTRFEREDPL